MRQADHLFRKYDSPGAKRFGKAAREVVAGIERLFYVNPYQLNRLVRAFRARNLKVVQGHARRLVQQWLDLMHVGDEILGAEALELLIHDFVLPGGSSKASKDAHLGLLGDTGIYLLATATNLTQGGLEVFGGFETEPVVNPRLQEGLLASSAFPAVFRPRWSWDLFPNVTAEHQYIDGGVMDNFPIDSVIKFLLEAQAENRITPRPGKPGENRPHLIFAASLEVDPPELHHRDEWEHLESDWPRLFSRSRELGYNYKLDNFAKGEHQLRAIYDQVLREAAKRDKDRQEWTPADLHTRIEPLDIEVVTVKPQWLCGTFAFHPMLGFRRQMQAKSIAHGCASTLLRFARVEESFRKAWDITGAVPEERGVGRAQERWLAWRKKHPKAAKDRCWLRPEKPCPFSRASLTDLNNGLADAGESTLPVDTVKELEAIHTYCRDPSTHRPDADSVGAVARALRRRGWAP